MISETKPKIKKVKRCRLCAKVSLKEILDFGMMSLPIWPRTKDGGVKAPLKLTFCTSCHLAQLNDSINRESLFREYWYRTGINDTMRSHMARLAEAVSQEIALADNDLVIDIGTNDGTLLRNFKSGRLIGFEPSNLCPRESKSGILWINDFFDPALLPKQDRHQALAITTIAMFYYFDSPIGFAKDIKSMLAENGIWVCEMSYALDLIKRLSFDFINHEHVTVWSASQFKRVVEKVGLELFRIELNDLNGGSIRFWAGRPGVRPVEPSVAEALALEGGYFTKDSWLSFGKRVLEVSQELRKIVFDLAKSGKTTMAYGASTRGLTILGSADLKFPLIRAAAERNLKKVGRYYGATGIPVISEDEMRSKRPDALLILPYSFIDEFVKRERMYLKKGGMFIVPLPEPRIITKSTKEVL